MGRLQVNDQLTAQELIFVEQIMLGKSAEQSAITAGYSPRSARTTGPRLLRRTAIDTELQSRRAKLLAKTDSLQDRIIAELERKAFSSFAEVIEVDEDGNPHLNFNKAGAGLLSTLNKVETKTRRIYTPKGEHIGTEVTAKVGRDDSLRALQMLGQTVGMFKQEEVKVTVDVADRLLEARRRVSGAAERGAGLDDEPLGAEYTVRDARKDQ